MIAQTSEKAASALRAQRVTAFAHAEGALASIITITAILILIAMVSIVFVAVVLRYGFGVALIFSYDVSTILFAWVIFLGLYVAEREGAHLGLDLIQKLGDGPLKTGLMLLRQTVLLLLAAYLTWIGWKLFMRTGSEIPSLRISAKWLYASLPVGFGLLSLAYLLDLGRLVASLRRR